MKYGTTSYRLEDVGKSKIDKIEKIYNKAYKRIAKLPSNTSNISVRNLFTSLSVKDKL